MAKILGVIPEEISTEQAAVGFGILAGVGGTLAQLVAGRRFSQSTSETIPVSDLTVPVIVGGGSTLLAALLVPINQ